jgi:hypothetical protein
MEHEVGITAGHTETLAFIERWLERFEGEPLTPKRPAPARRRTVKKASG